jgi:hypothetical protein
VEGSVVRAAKALLLAVVGLAVASAIYLGVAYKVRSIRVGPVNGWMRSANGFGPAKSAEDAMDKFRQAIEKHDYDAAGQFLSGEYKEFFDKGTDDAESLVAEIDNLKAAMKKNGVKSDKGYFVLFMLEPFPAGFKYDLSKGDGDAKVATLSWANELSQYAGADLQGLQSWQVDTKMWNSLMPLAVDVRVPLQVTVKKEKDGFWRIQFPTSTGTTANARHVRDSVDYLRKNGSNFKNALQGLKNDVKNEPQTKENFESSLKVKLEQSK